MSNALTRFGRTANRPIEIRGTGGGASDLGHGCREGSGDVCVVYRTAEAPVSSPWLRPRSLPTRWRSKVTSTRRGYLFYRFALLGLVAVVELRVALFRSVFDCYGALIAVLC